ncbi:MAG: protein tyrosine phosphatase family protein [Chromatiales bacterium]|nr:protein tyrosine phosphatase family protein [Chromatiales bacterium]
MSVESILNFIQVTDRLASSGQPEDGQFKLIAEAGYEVVINLAMPNSDNAIPEEGYLVTARKMRYIHIPVPFEAPNAGHLRDFIGVMDGLSRHKVWVHCVLNYRVSAFLYQYHRLMQGWSDEQAKGIMLHSWQPNQVWRDFMSLTADAIR